MEQKSRSKLLQPRYAAPSFHVILFCLTWGLASVSSKPLMDGIAALPFALLYIVDIPISVMAFGAFFSSGTAAPIVTWGALGTLWWYLLGRSIEAWILRYRNRRNATG
jgi:hypothetical protein